MKHHLLSTALLSIGLLFTTSCKKSDSTSPSTGGTHGSVTFNGKTTDFAVVVVSGTSNSKAVVANAYGTENNYSVGFTVLSPPPGGGEISLGSIGSDYLIVSFIIAPKAAGSAAEYHHYGVSGEKIHYSLSGGKDVYTATNLTEVDGVTGNALASGVPLSFTIKQ